MPESESTRRQFLSGIAGAGVGAWLAANAAQLGAIETHAATVAPDEPYEFFTPEQVRKFEAVSAQRWQHLSNRLRVSLIDVA